MMQISIERSDRMYTVTVGKQPIVTLWAWWDQEVKEFIRQVRRIHGKRNSQDLIVGLWADHSANYSGGDNYYYDSRRGDNKRRPLEVMGLCVGHHCLFIQLQASCSKRKLLKDFLYDRQTVVVGVGIERLAKKLEEENGILIPRRVELRGLAQADRGLQQEDGNSLNLSKCSLGQLARVVLGEEMAYVRPTTIRWRQNHRLSDDLVKFSTAEAFLAAQIGAKLLKNGSQSSQSSHMIRF